MPQLILSDASLAYGHVPLLDHADFQLDPGERVAVIGRNGTGKSSLLRALAGQGALDDGTVWRQPGMRLGYVPQEPPFDSELTVFEAVVAGMGEVSALLAEYHAVSLAMADDSADHDLLLERMNRLQGELESRHAWSFETQAERVIQRFSLDPDARVGQRLKVDVQRLAEAPRREHRRRKLGLLQELQEMLEGVAQHRRVNNGCIGHKAPRQSRTFDALFKHILGTTTTDSALLQSDGPIRQCEARAFPMVRASRPPGA